MKALLWGSPLLASLPLFMLLCGCGGSDGGLTRTPTPTPSFTPTATPSSGGTVTSSVTFTKSRDSNFVEAPLAPTLILTSFTDSSVLVTGGQGSNRFGSLLLSVLITNPVAGQTYNKFAFKGSSQLIDTPGKTMPFYYSVRSGTVTVNEFDSTTVSVTYNNVVFAPNEGTTEGTVTVNGTISGSYRKN